MKIIKQVVKAFRSQTSALNLPKQAKPEMAVRCRNPDHTALINNEADMIIS